MAVPDGSPRVRAEAVFPGGRGLWRDALSRLVRNRLALVGGIVVLLLAVAAVFAPWLAPSGYAEGDLLDNYASPGREHWLGADFLGRDVLSRLIYGARVSLTVGVVGALTAFAIGMAYGSVSGFYGGKTDDLLMRFVDLMYSIPTLLIIILIMVYFRSAVTAADDLNAVVRAIRTADNAMGGMLVIFLGIGVSSWMTMARLSRGSVLALRESEFVMAARAAGSSDARIVLRDLLPNIIGPLIVAETLNIPHYILLEAFLSFIGLGVNAPTPSWGGMISEGIRSMRSHPHLALFPAVALSVALFAFNFLGDGLRDAFDPRMRGTTSRRSHRR